MSASALEIFLVPSLVDHLLRHLGTVGRHLGPGRLHLYRRHLGALAPENGQFYLLNAFEMEVKRLKRHENRIQNHEKTLKLHGKSSGDVAFEAEVQQKAHAGLSQRLREGSVASQEGALHARDAYAGICELLASLTSFMPLSSSQVQQV